MARNRLYHGVLGASSAQLYASDNTYTTITAATVQNVTGGAVTLDVWVTADGVAVADASLVFEGLSVAANTAVGLPLLVGHTMGRGDELHAVASSGAALTLRVSGDVVTG